MYNNEEISKSMSNSEGAFIFHLIENEIQVLFLSQKAILTNIFSKKYLNFNKI